MSVKGRQADGRTHPAVVVLGEADQAWLVRLRQSLPPQTRCYVSAGEAPDEFEALPLKHAGLTALTEALQSKAVCAWITVRPGLELPEFWFERMQKAAGQDPALGVVQPLSNLHPDLSPLPAGESRPHVTDAAALDRLVYALGRRTYFDTDRLTADCAWWSPGAIKLLAQNAGKDAAQVLRSAGQPVRVLDHLYVHDPGKVLAGPPRTQDPDRRPPPHPLSTLRGRVARAWTENDIPAVQTPGLDKRPVLLHITHSWGGGIERFINDFIHAGGQRSHLVLASAGQSDAHSYGQVLRLYAGPQGGAVIREWRLPVPIHSTEIRAPSYREILADVIRDFAVDQVLISSLIGHSLEALETGLPTALVAHDYFPVCPALNIYFDEVCDNCKRERLTRCLKQNPYNRLFIDKDAASWLHLRDAYVERILNNRVALAAPSDSVRAHLTRIEPRLKQADFRLIPHGLNAWPHGAKSAGNAPIEGKLRLVLVGRLKSGKGRALLQRALPELGRYADIWLIGCGKETAGFLGQSGVHLIFDYPWSRLPQILATVQPHAGLLLSTVPETFGYTLSELLSLRLPVIAVNRGAYAERIVHEGNGLLIENDAADLIAAVKRLANDRELLQTLRSGVARTTVNSLDDMAQGYRRLLPVREQSAARYHWHVPGPDVLVETALRNDLGEARARLHNAALALEENKQELLERASWGHRLQKQLNRRAAELTQRAAQVEALEQELRERADWAHALDQEVAGLRGDIRELQHSLDGLRRDYDTVLASRSWRWTAPLRVATRRLRAGRDSVRFQTSRWRTLGQRAHNSLKVRGLAGTLARIGRERPRQNTVPASPAPGLPEPGELRIPSTDNPRVSMIIPAFNNSALTFACLHSIAIHAGETPFEVIVVNDASVDDTAAVLADVSGIRVESHATNQGFIAACNGGAARARGEFLVFLNNDTTVTEGWLEGLLATFDDHRDTGLAGAKLVYPDGRLQEAGGTVFADGSGWNYGRDDDPGKPEYSYVREVDYCSGACIAIRKDLFDELGGFDKRYAPAYYEDTDLAFKVRAAGWQVMFQPGAVVAHHEGAASGTDTQSGTKRFQVINQKKFRDRWHAALALQPPPGTPIAKASRHRLKGRVLIVDAVVPQPDQDSGSLRMVNLIELLQGLGYAVSFMPANLTATPPYTQQLQQRGVEMLHLPWVASPPAWFAENGAGFDVVFLSRHYVARDFIWLARRHCTRARIVFDTVDLHFLRAERLSDLHNTQALAKTAARTRKEELGVARQADLTLVVSPFEQQFLQREAPDLRVEVLSNIHHVFGCRVPFAKRRDIWFVGGFQHPPNIDAMVWFVGEVWPLVRTRLPGTIFHIVGSKLVPEIERLAGEDIKVHGYVPDVTPFLDGCRLAVAPLRYGAGVKGKVNQSMAYGQPVVATPAAVEGMFVENGKEVLVAGAGADFADAVVRLYDDEGLWSRLSENGQENVRRYFSFGAARSALANILDIESESATTSSRGEASLSS